MITTHNDLMKKAKQFLLDKGYKESEIFFNYQIKLKDKGCPIVDVAGINNKEKIGIECGGIGKDVKCLYEFFDKIVVFPYVYKEGNTFFCSYCDSSWNARVEKPKQCPSCKRYIFYTNGREEIIYNQDRR